ncbi:DUF418 domain-containing protein [Micromonospora sp. PLK6-60]|uniref:DUF418 domain-containing protein n=1 Tax=Micromonospora sp. PLK6-60 TaxID=2873383 RepID=UPI001CA669E1|nr:DUF418 domain-containing protein [Micromonospora sp. PLK6-60]MBY8870601.1 DUF418 domain-containing protein [Micromonospora sp. PLK6-60]
MNVLRSDRRDHGRPRPSSGDNPTGDDARINVVDALRGTALLLILLVNVAFFRSGFAFHLVDDPADGVLDRLVAGAVELLFAMKAYLLFAFLFGYSFTLQIDSAARRGAAFGRSFRRRMAGLFAIGAVHAVLLFHGDILTTYALLGLVLLAVARIAPRTALVVAAAIVGVVAFAVGVAAVLGATLVPDQAAALAAGAQSTQALRGGIGAVVLEHLRSLPAMLGGLAVQGPLAFAAFLVGLAAGKHRMLASVPAHEHLLRRCEQVGYPVGLAGATVFAVGGGTANLTGLMVSIVTAPLLAAAYAATLLRLFTRLPRVADAVAPAGRLALTNYLGQSLGCLLVFTGVGLGLAGRTSPAQTLLIALAIFGVQVAASAWWLRRFRYGPAEWVLRAWTHRTRPAMRR